MDRTKSQQLFAVKNGRIWTCTFPGLKIERHPEVFRQHRYGHSQGVLYFLEKDSSCYFDDPGHALRSSGTLKTYDLKTRKIKAQIGTCTCNKNTAQLLLRGNTLIDIGKYPRLITTTQRNSSPILELVGFAEFSDFAVHFHLKKTVYLFAGENHVRSGNGLETGMVSAGPSAQYEIEDGDGRHLTHSLFFKINAVNYTVQLLQPKVTPPLNTVSLIPLTAGEFLVLGHRKDEDIYRAYRLTETTVCEEGTSKHKLSRCSSSLQQGNSLYMFFESGLLAKLNLKSGGLVTMDFHKFGEIKTCIWIWQKALVHRLPLGLLRAVTEYLAAESED